METDWTLAVPDHDPLYSEDDGFDDDYLWTCDCGAKGEDIATRDAHVLSMAGWKQEIDHPQHTLDGKDIEYDADGAMVLRECRRKG